MKNIKKYSHISYEERFVIEKLFNAKVSIRRISDFLKRSPGTISGEIRKNSTKGIYTAEKANKKAHFKRWKSKRQCLKVSMDRFLCRFVEDKLHKKWSPEQISGFLKEEMNMVMIMYMYIYWSSNLPFLMGEYTISNNYYTNIYIYITIYIII